MKNCFTLFALLTLLYGVHPARAFDTNYHEKINGVMLHFRVRGEDKNNPYLVILHGGPGFSAYMFYHWGPLLEKSLNVVYLDQRGCGGSQRFPAPDPFNPSQNPALKKFTVENMVKDIEGVREFLHVNKWYVLGHSWGGLLGLVYVTTDPEHVLGFIDMDGAYSFRELQDSVLDNCMIRFQKQAETGTADQKKTAAELIQQVETLKKLPPSNPERLFGAFQLAMGSAGLYFSENSAKKFSEFQKEIQAAVAPYHVSPLHLAQSYEPALGLIQTDHLATLDETGLLHRVKVPTLILNGKEDGVVTPAMAEKAHKEMRDSELDILNQCGHFPFEERPNKTAADILAFVKTKH